MQELSAVFRITGPNIDRTTLTVTRSGVTVGRISNNDLMLNHSQISRRHMRIFWQDGSFWVEDMGSTNGVWLNDNRLSPNVPQQVARGDTIRLGPYALTFEQMANMAEPAPGSAPLNGAPYESNGPKTLQELPISPGVIEEAVPVRPRLARRRGGPSLAEAVVPKVRLRENRYPQGIPQDRSNWLQYLPAIYSDSNLDPTHFIGRYLLIFESLFSPVMWMVDNFDLYLSPETAPPEWMQWMAGWFDVTLLEVLPVERQRAIMSQLGWLFLRRGTKPGLERILELYFGVKPEIIENVDGPHHFLVRLPLSLSNIKIDPEYAGLIIDAQKPAFTVYTLEIT